VPRGPDVLVKNGLALIFIGLSTFNGFVVIAKNGLALSWVVLHIPTASTTHGKNHQVHDLDVISNDNVVEFSDFQCDGLSFIPLCKKQKNRGKSSKKSYDNTCKFQIK
jgi:hypothetical protein